MKKLTFILVILILLNGCNFLDKKTAVLCTNIPEMAAYVELFNAIQSEYRVEIVYDENPADQNKLSNNTNYDIIISENLNSANIIKSFSSLKKIVDKKQIDPSIFYSSLYKLGFYNNEPRLFPVSFNVPAIFYRSDNYFSDNESITFTPQMLQEEGLNFNNNNGKLKNAMGFSSLWEPEFIISLAFLNNTDFSESSKSGLVWNNEKLKETIDYCKNLSEINLGFEKEKDFNMTYCYDPGYKLVNSGRIGYYYSSLREFYQIPSNERSLLSLKWFGSKSSIPVKQDIVFAGIPSLSKKRKTALNFLLWFFNLDNQKQMMESAKFKRLQGFGICDGFSSIINVNEFVIPNYYRTLVGNIPPKDFLSFPANLPNDWEAMQNDAIIPWIKSQLLEEPAKKELEEVLKTWVMQQQKK